MSSEPVDVLVEIHQSFDINENISPESSKIYTNAYTSALDEILSNWVQDQVGSGRDASPVNKSETYIIKIGLFLSDDTFGTESNTGNKALTVGIVMNILNRLNDIPVFPLSMRPMSIVQKVMES